MRPLLVALLALLAAPGLARAGDVAMVVRDVPLGPRSLEAVSPPTRFDMVGLHWQGPGAVLFRTHRLTGSWGPWTAADADSAPDLASPERLATRAWHDGAPVWTGGSDRIQFHLRGRVTRLRAYYLWSRVVRPLTRQTATAGTPAIVSRLGWGANERIVRAKPQYAPALRLAIVHHTVNTNTYTRAQAPAIVRGIETYHVLGNGWNDIGYNFLIDRFGTIYEGRAGGIARNVVGAHAMGFNTGSVGVALIGTYQSVAPTPAQRAALVKLLAWRLDVAHVDPLSLVPFVSLGNPRFPRGTPVVLRAISGHRDTYFTECPGQILYDELPVIARAVAATGLPKIYAPAARGVAPEAVRFTATLSSARPWTVTVTDRTGAVVASGSGTGAKVSWTWSGVTAAPGPYAWSIQSPGARPATGSLGGSAPPPPPPAVPLLSALAAPAVVAPAPDGSGATATATFSLGAAAQVTATLLDATGAAALTVLSQHLDAGPQSVDASLAGLPDGRYRLVVAAKGAAGASATLTAPVLVDRTLTGFATAWPTISPNGDGVLDTETLSFSLAQAVPLQVSVQQAGAVVASIFDGQLGPGQQVLQWDGRDATGATVPDGAYQVVASFTDAQGPVSVTVPLTIDTTPPTLTLLDAATLRFSLSEPATVTLLVNGAHEVKVEPAGTFTVPPPKAGVQTVSAQAQDAGGNVSPTVSSP